MSDGGSGAVRCADAPTIADALSAQLGVAVDPAPVAGVDGGCTQPAWRWRAGRDLLFVKTALADQGARFAAEAAGLRELATAAALRVPAVVGHGLAGATAWLALEWLDLVEPDARAESALGEGLATLHRTRAPAFGWHADNFIGRTPQANGWCEDAVEFLRERRLRPQLSQVSPGGELGARLRERGERLLEVVGVFYTSYRPAPSLLHGDLWSGNRAALRDGTPVVFDPAPYFGDREADVAMTRLFGGFGPRFHAAYQSAWPLDAAAGYRRELHNLYHVLNHHRLFGGGYARQALSMIDSLLAEAGA